MKKKNIFLFILFGIIILGFNSKVMADDDVIAFLECKYKLNKSDIINEFYVDDNNVITFAYSDLYFEEDRVKRQVFIRDRHLSGVSYELANSESNLAAQPMDRLGKYYKNKHTLKNLGNIDETFRNLVGEDGTCPKHFVLKKSDGNKYIPYFDNNTERCGEKNTQCLVVGTNINDGEKAILHGNEKELNFKIAENDSKEACQGLNVSLYVKDRKIMGKISYPKSTSFYEKTAKTAVKDIHVALTSGGDYTPLQMQAIHALFVENKIYSLWVRGSKGKEEIHFAATSSNSDVCSRKDVMLTPTYNCTTFDEAYSHLKSDVEKYIQLANEYKKIITGKLCARPGYEDSTDLADFSICDYSSYTAEELKKLYKEIDGYNSKTGPELVELFGRISENYEKQSKEICAEFKKDLEKSIGAVKIVNETSYKVAAKRLDNILKEIKNQKQIKDDKEFQEEIDNSINKNEELIEKNEHYYKISDQIFFVEGKLDFASKTGCDMVTPELKKWLLNCLDIIKVAALVLTLILGMFDFFKGIASGNADTMKKVWTSFSRRLIVVVILFLLPVVLEFILGLANINGVVADNPLCGLK